MYTSPDVREHCGIFVAHSLHDVYSGMTGLQHRGQDSAGIGVRTREGIDILRWEGMVKNFSLQNAYSVIPGDLYIGHVRYRTHGETEKLFEGAHPRHFGGKIKAKHDMHMIIRGARSAIIHNGTIPGLANAQDIDIDTEIILKVYERYGIGGVLENIPCSYAAAILERGLDQAVVFRDRKGIKPLWIGEKDGSIVASSEDIAIWEIGGTPIREVNPGEAIYIKMDGTDFDSEQVVEPDPHYCQFEDPYNMSRSSTNIGRPIRDTRMNLGRVLAEEYRPPVDVDLVTYVPMSPEQMARGYSDRSGIRFEKVFYKINNVRAYLQPDQASRINTIRNTLFVRDNVKLRGKRLLIIEDSIVRFNNAVVAAEKLKERGVEWIGLALATPPIGVTVDGEVASCDYGNFMPSDDDFAAQRFQAPDGGIDIDAMIADSPLDDIYYITLGGKEKAEGVSLSQRCYRCLGGPKPITDDEEGALREFVDKLYADST